jgi:hypothetical protein
MIIFMKVSVLIKYIVMVMVLLLPLMNYNFNIYSITENINILMTIFVVESVL